MVKFFGTDPELHVKLSFKSQVCLKLNLAFKTRALKTRPPLQAKNIKFSAF